MKTLFEEPVQTEIIRALWWKQPFASLMLHGKIETRTHSTNVRGKVLICACKEPYTYEQLKSLSCDHQIKEILNVFNAHSYAALCNMLPLGKAIGIGNLANCRRHAIGDMPKSFVNHDLRLWLWIFEDSLSIEPFEIKGKQGWAILDEETKSKIKIK